MLKIRYFHHNTYIYNIVISHYSPSGIKKQMSKCKECEIKTYLCCISNDLIALIN